MSDTIRNAQGTTFSDEELKTWSTIKRADEATTYWGNLQREFSAPVAIGPLAGELLEARRLLRDFIARHDKTTQDSLVLRAVDLLGFNLDPIQPLFPNWPEGEWTGKKL